MFKSFFSFFSEKGISIGFILPITLLMGSIIWVGYSVVWKNINAKDVVFSYSALVAAFAMFTLNIIFSLKSEVIQKTIPIHLLHDENELNIYTPSIKKPLFLDNTKTACNEIGIPNEKEVIESKLLYGDNHFKEKVNDFLRLTLISTIVENKPDWEMTEKRFLFTSYGSFNYKKEGAGKNSFYDIETLFKELNLPLYESYKLHTLTEGITLPPKTIITGNNKGITLENETVKIKIHVEMGNSFKKMPFKYSGKIIYFSMGDVEDENKNPTSYDANIYFNVLFKLQRSFNPKLKEQQAWVENLFLTLEESLSPYKNS